MVTEPNYQQIYSNIARMRGRVKKLNDDYDPYKTEALAQASYGKQVDMFNINQQQAYEQGYRDLSLSDKYAMGDPNISYIDTDRKRYLVEKTGQKYKGQDIYNVQGVGLSIGYPTTDYTESNSGSDQRISGLLVEGTQVYRYEPYNNSAGYRKLKKVYTGETFSPEGTVNVPTPEQLAKYQPQGSFLSGSPSYTPQTPKYGANTVSRLGYVNKQDESILTQKAASSRLTITNPFLGTTTKGGIVTERFTPNAYNPEGSMFAQPKSTFEAVSGIKDQDTKAFIASMQSKGYNSADIASALYQSKPGERIESRLALYDKQNEIKGSASQPLNLMSSPDAISGQVSSFTGTSYTQLTPGQLSDYGLSYTKQDLLGGSRIEGVEKPTKFGKDVTSTISPLTKMMSTFFAPGRVATTGFLAESAFTRTLLDTGSINKARTSAYDYVKSSGTKEALFVEGLINTKGSIKDRLSTARKQYIEAMKRPSIESELQELSQLKLQKINKEYESQANKDAVITEKKITQLNKETENKIKNNKLIYDKKISSAKTEQEQQQLISEFEARQTEFINKYEAEQSSLISGYETKYGKYDDQGNIITEGNKQKEYLSKVNNKLGTEEYSKYKTIYLSGLAGSILASKGITGETKLPFLKLNIGVLPSIEQKDKSVKLTGMNPLFEIGVTKGTKDILYKTRKELLISQKGITPQDVSLTKYGNIITSTGEFYVGAQGGASALNEFVSVLPEIKAISKIPKPSINLGTVSTGILGVETVRNPRIIPETVNTLFYNPQDIALGLATFTALAPGVDILKRGSLKSEFTPTEPVKTKMFKKVGRKTSLVEEVYEPSKFSSKLGDDYILTQAQAGTRTTYNKFLGIKFNEQLPEKVIKKGTLITDLGRKKADLYYSESSKSATGKKTSIVKETPIELENVRLEINSDNVLFSAYMPTGKNTGKALVSQSVPSGMNGEFLTSELIFNVRKGKVVNTDYFTGFERILNERSGFFGDKVYSSYTMSTPSKFPTNKGKKVYDQGIYDNIFYQNKPALGFESDAVTIITRKDGLQTIIGSKPRIPKDQVVPANYVPQYDFGVKLPKSPQKITIRKALYLSRKYRPIVKEYGTFKPGVERGGVLVGTGINLPEGMRLKNVRITKSIEGMPQKDGKWITLNEGTIYETRINSNKLLGTTKMKMAVPAKDVPWYKPTKQDIKIIDLPESTRQLAKVTIGSKGTYRLIGNVKGKDFYGAVKTQKGELSVFKKEKPFSKPSSEKSLYVSYDDGLISKTKKKSNTFTGSQRSKVKFSSQFEEAYGFTKTQSPGNIVYSNLLTGIEIGAKSRFKPNLGVPSNIFKSLGQVRNKPVEIMNKVRSRSIQKQNIIPSQKLSFKDLIKSDIIDKTIVRPSSTGVTRYDTITPSQGNVEKPISPQLTNIAPQFVFNYYSRQNTAGGAGGFIPGLGASGGGKGYSPDPWVGTGLKTYKTLDLLNPPKEKVYKDKPEVRVMDLRGLF